LPDFDPTAALAGIDAEPSGPSRAARRGGTTLGGGSGGSGGLGSDGSRATGSGGGGSGGSGGTDATGGTSDEGGTTRTRSEADAERRDDHPLSDVWGDG
jgi:hypothetical protein